MRSARHLIAAALASALGAAAVAARQPEHVGPRSPEDIDGLAHQLEADRSAKVRTQAAIVLGRIGDRRAVPALLRALGGDRSPEVRGVAARALGEMADPGTRDALQTAMRDRDHFVRERAEEAVHRIDTTPPDGALALPGGAFVVVGAVGGRIAEAQRTALRAALAAELGRLGPGGTPRVPATRGFLVDLTVTRSRTVAQQDPVESEAAVRLMLSLWPTHALVTSATGEAAVQKPRPQFRPVQQGSMESEAVAAALRSAVESLAGVLSASR